MTKPLKDQDREAQKIAIREALSAAFDAYNKAWADYVNFGCEDEDEGL